jgi:hypothetical protein
MPGLILAFTRGRGASGNDRVKDADRLRMALPAMAPFRGSGSVVMRQIRFSGKRILFNLKANKKIFSIFEADQISRSLPIYE